MYSLTVFVLFNRFGEEARRSVRGMRLCSDNKVLDEEINAIINFHYIECCI